MLKVTLAMEEWLKIGEDIHILFDGVTERYVHVLVDAPKSVPISRSAAIEKNMGKSAFQKDQTAVKKAIKGDADTQADFSQWLRQSERLRASFAVYGRGKLARECYNAILTGGTQEIVAYVNLQRPKNDLNIPSERESALKNPRIDYIVIAEPDEKSYHGAENRLLELGVPKEKIYWCHSCK